ncbi:BTB/POZ domain with WD40/YVTN repeat-like protein [Actinidia rufa]|uniref:BTB/POZ domain with WD40/YVTN repeat-like protein n=1 Tax=Actinidia rufa TaxID=165716 RepID=A0A7J0DGH9_9ERIC|nr:BTB/POZ domain with WD40/YVTN repeat-like protein [Actinidia rufa]
MGIQKDRVRFNVGGKIIETTTTSTLAVAGRNSFFGAMFDEYWNLQTENSLEFFIDRNPNCFSILLDLLRTGELCIPSHIPEKLLYREAQFYGLLDHVRAAKWGPFDGNRLRFSRAVTGQAPGDGTAIRAGPDGGCCVAHGSIVHVYDWMLQELPPINLDYQRVNDIGWIDARRPWWLLPASGWAAEVAGHPCLGSPLENCGIGRSNEYGVGVWDQITGQQIDFYYEPIGWSLGDADRLQWLDNTNCLLVATLFPRKDNCYISLLDFREKNMVWSWSDIGAPTTDERRVRDAIAMEESSSICVVNEYEDLGFMDLRSSSASVRWCSRSRLMKGKMPDEPCYPKLALHEGQLFSSMNDSISVFSGPDWVLTSSLRRSYGGSICDFSIGGERLFALHSEENVFDIWEAPPLPVT